MKVLLILLFCGSVFAEINTKNLTTLDFDNLEFKLSKNNQNTKVKFVDKQKTTPKVKVNFLPFAVKNNPSQEKIIIKYIPVYIPIKIPVYQPIFIPKYIPIKF